MNEDDNSTHENGEETSETSTKIWEGSYERPDPDTERPTERPSQSQEEE